MTFLGTKYTVGAVLTLDFLTVYCVFVTVILYVFQFEYVYEHVLRGEIGPYNQSQQQSALFVVPLSCIGSSESDCFYAHNDVYNKVVGDIGLEIQSDNDNQLRYVYDHL